MDAWLIAAVADEVDTLCRGGRIQRVGQPRPDDVAIEIHAPRAGAGPATRHLLISAHPRLCRAHLTGARQPNPKSPPAFCQALRRHIEGARVAGCRQPGLERALALDLVGRDELGNPRALTLVAELTGRLANMLLIDAGGRIIDCLRRVDEERNRYRELLPGRTYLPPPVDRTDPVLLLLERGAEAARQDLAGAFRASGHAGAAAVAHVVFGLSPTLCGAAAAWADGAPGAPPAAGAETAGDAGDGPEPSAYRLAGAVLAIAAAVRDRRFAPCVLEAPASPAGAVPAMPLVSRTGAAAAARPATGNRSAATPTAPAAAPWPSAWPLPGWRARPAASASAACAEAYEAATAAAATREAAHTLEVALRSARQRLTRRLDKQRQEEQEAAAADDLRQAGEVLLAYGHMVARGQTRAQLPALDDPGRTVTVTLDPALTAAGNAQRLLRRYQKARRAQVQVAARTRATVDDLRYIDEAEWSLDQADTLEVLQALRAELAQQGVLGAARHPAAASAPRPERHRASPGERRQGSRARPGVPSLIAGPEPLAFAAAGGWRILVGRNAAGNDTLTMRTGRPDDVWLHARQMPGSHVLLRPPAGGPGHGAPPDEALLQAARCAAHFSTGRAGARVPVDHTLRRHVWKPNGARPGFVLYDHERTLMVAPSDLPPRA